MQTRFSPSTGIKALSLLPRKISRGLLKALTAFPFISFFVVFGALICVIALGDYLKPVPVVEETVAEAKQVVVFPVDSDSDIRVQAKVEKSGVVQLIAQSSGVVQKIRVAEGKTVKRGTPVLSLSTNYQGGNIASTSRQIAQKNNQFVNDTYQTQLDAVGKSREIASKTETQAAQLRSIARQSIDDTKAQISLNEDILNSIDKQIKGLELINVNGASDSAILALKSSKAQTLGALNGLRSGLRNTEYLNSDDKEAAQIAQLVRDNTLKQLEIQEKSLALNKEISGLNLRIAQISESLMYPASPCPGVVERVHVKVGQLVNPGTLLATITTTDTSATAVVLVSSQVAKNVSTLLPSYLMINNDKVQVTARHISGEPTDGNLHSILYTVPETYTEFLSNNSYVEAIIPIGLSQKSDGATPYIPLDAVYQNQDSASVYIVGKNELGQAIVVNKTVTLGAIYGTYVAVTEGITVGDQVITDRTVIPGQLITPITPEL
jgi:multidrug efflux pump subunit AcrA (membrane-fusion protein)